MTTPAFRLALVPDCGRVSPMPRGSIERWTSWLYASGAATGTVRLRRRYVLEFLTQHPDPANVTTDDVMTYLARHGWAPETRRSARSSLRSYFRWCVLTDRLIKDPTLAAPPVRVPLGVPRPCPEKAISCALATSTPDVRLMVLLAAYAGLRRAEIARVHSDDVTDLGLRVEGKGGRVRLVPIHPMLTGPLRNVDGWAFPSPIRPGQPVHPDYVGKRVKAALGGTWTTHSCRHRFATRAYAGTHDLRAVQLLLGHSKPETTARYVAVAQQDLVAAVAAVA